ncbi:MAG: AMP-binding protein [Cellulomonadaceae bacterium]|jgi:crotonobetaine/carnitine-CoA ligase|nr:AMP-binding protein [Cellulomonadaceae bacterium]
MVDGIGPLTLIDLWGWLRREFADRPFLTFVHAGGAGADGAVHKATYQQFDDETNRVANLLASLGVTAGTNVVFQLPSSVDFLHVMFAIIKLGAVAIPVAHQYTQREVEHIWQRCEPQVAVVAADKAAVTHHLPGLRTLVVAGGTQQTLTSTPAIVALETRADYPATTPEVEGITGSSPAMMLFTSGTTAAPKGVVITHANCLHAGLYHNWQMAMRPDDRLLTPMPMEHSNFQLAALMPALTAVAELIVVERYSARRFWGQVRQYQATLLQAVAMIVRTLLLQPESADDADHSVRDIQYYLALDDDAKEEFERRFNTRLLNCYGLTETINWVLTDFPVGPRRWPSIGRPGLGYEARIVDSDGQELPAGEIGEIQIRGERGRTLMLEYYHDPEATKNAFTEDGWFRPHDRGYMDSQGWFYFVGRRNDIIKRAGRNVSALEIEGQLRTHPQVEDAAVVGVPDVIRDEAIVAFVTPKPGCTLEAADVTTYIAGRVAEYKVPGEMHILTEFPRTSTGKIAKRELSHLRLSAP